MRYRLQGGPGQFAQRGGNAVLLHFESQNSLRLSRASVCNERNLGYFRKTRGQTGTKCCKLQHGLPLGGGGGGLPPPDHPEPQPKARGFKATHTRRGSADLFLLLAAGASCEAYKKLIQSLCKAHTKLIQRLHKAYTKIIYKAYTKLSVL